MSWKSCSVASCADRRGAPTPTILTGSELALLLIHDVEGQRRQRRRRRGASISQWGALLAPPEPIEAARPSGTSPRHPPLPRHRTRSAPREGSRAAEECATHP